ncbi:MAG: ABC transporter ATP-binding protein [Nitrospinae bacterium]|nr:ABC transporter ATP-binding protein [Nitrospinota bacterium]
MLDVHDLQVSYGVTDVLKGVSITVPARSIIALLGGNGSGKTTTLNTISGFLTPRGGSISFVGERIDSLSPDRIVKRGIVQVPQGREVFATMTVQENLELGAVTRRDGGGIAQDMQRLFDMFPVLRERRLQKAGTLSGGEQQMLAIARALMARPRLLLMDEPSAGLAPLVVQDIMRVIRELHRGGQTILLVEQNIGVALTLASRAYVLKDGEIALAGDAASLLTNPEVIRSYLGG